jgi:S-DNA-T family DNA segregation ATPase FtsK/SpoIIIE
VEFVPRLFRHLKTLRDRLETGLTISREKTRRWRREETQSEQRRDQGRPKIVESPPPPALPTQQIPFPFLEGKGDYQLPPLSLLQEPPPSTRKTSKEEMFKNATLLEKKLLDYGIEGKVTQVHPGPVITMYEFEPAPGVKVNRIVNLSDDIALAMRAMAVRIVAPIPGKAVVGIEIPNPQREEVTLKEILTQRERSEGSYLLPLALGKDIFGQPVLADLSAMPHLLVAGATGSGKSVALNTMVLSLLFTASPREVRFLMIDPKMLELSAYDGLPHLLAPVITKPREAANLLQRMVMEMQERYKKLAEMGVRNIESYNKAIGSKTPSEPVGIKPAPGKVEPPTSKEPPEPLPYLVIIIDELADLMISVAAEIEDSIARLAQMARAAGIHLILATQRPSVDVITGVIKANFSTRISFQVTSKTDSRTILDTNGAEHLLGKGDMLYLTPGTGRIIRIHGAYVSDTEIKRVVDFIKNQAPSRYEELLPPKPEGEGSPENERDQYYEQAIELVTSTSHASISMIQRRLRIGYNRAARMVEMMEEDGIVGPSIGGKPREVLVRGFDREEG